MTLSSQESRTIQSYDEIAGEWARWLDDDPDLWRTEFQDFHRLIPAGRVLDVGCGSGRDTHFFLETDGYEYIGIDASRGMLEEARKRNSQGQFVQMNMRDLCFQESTFDAFWAVASLFHIPKKRMFRFLGSLSRVLKDGAIGYIVMEEGKGERMERASGFKEEASAFLASWQKDEFARVLNSAGFIVIDSESKRRKTGNEVFGCFVTLDE